MSVPFRPVPFPVPTNSSADADVDVESDAHMETLIAELQPALRSYVAGLMGGVSGVQDVVQETNIFLWDRRSDFTAGTNFRAWAFKVAWFKVMAARRERMRQRQVCFSEPILEQIAAQAEQRHAVNEARLTALQSCLTSLPEEDRALLQWKYAEGKALTDLAQAKGHSEAAIHKRISRLRLALRHCIENRLRKEKKS